MTSRLSLVVSFLQTTTDISPTPALLLPLSAAAFEGAQRVANLRKLYPYISADLNELLTETVERVLTIAAARRERAHVLRYLDSSESCFELANDPVLIAPLVAYLQDDLERIGFADNHTRSQIGTALLVEWRGFSVCGGRLS